MSLTGRQLRLVRAPDMRVIVPVINHAGTTRRMIDYFALALGHGLLAIVLLRLVWRDDLDVDPAIADNQAAEEQRRKDALAARKQAARGETLNSIPPAPDETAT